MSRGGGRWTSCSPRGHTRGASHRKAVLIPARKMPTHLCSGLPHEDALPPPPDSLPACPAHYSGVLMRIPALPRRTMLNGKDVQAPAPLNANSIWRDDGQHRANPWPFLFSVCIIGLLNQALAMAQQRCPGSLHLACLFGQPVKQLAAETMGFSLLRVQAKLNVI